jgi:predicted PurR-regulated permease PerM
VAFGALFGFLGLIVATPVMAVIIVLVKELYVKQLEAGM